MGIFKEFKEFAMKGNVIDLAVGIVIGTAFGKIVSSLVADIIMPTVGLIAGKVDFQSLAYTLLDENGEILVNIAYGKFIQTVVDFLIIAFSIFFVVKLMNSAQRRLFREEEKAAPPGPAEDILLLREIRDELKKQA